MRGAILFIDYDARDMLPLSVRALRYTTPSLPSLIAVTLSILSATRWFAALPSSPFMPLAVRHLFFFFLFSHFKTTSLRSYYTTIFAYVTPC